MAYGQKVLCAFPTKFLFRCISSMIAPQIGHQVAIYIENQLLGCLWMIPLSSVQRFFASTKSKWKKAFHHIANLLCTREH